MSVILKRGSKVLTGMYENWGSLSHYIAFLPSQPRPYSGMLLRNVVLLLTCRKHLQPDLIPTSNIDTSLLQRYDSSVWIFFFKMKAKRCHNSCSIYDVMKNIAFDGKYRDIHPFFKQLRGGFNINVSQNTIKSFRMRLIWRYFFKVSQTEGVVCRPDV